MTRIMSSMRGGYKPLVHQAGRLLPLRELLVLQVHLRGIQLVMESCTMHQTLVHGCMVCDRGILCGLAATWRQLQVHRGHACACAMQWQDNTFTSIAVEHLVFWERLICTLATQKRERSLRLYMW